MYATFSAVFPVFILLVLGNLARRTGFLDEAFWSQVEKGTYYVLFPALLVSRLSRASFEWQEQLWLLIAALLMLLTGAALCFLLQRLLRFPVNDFTSFFQGGIRFNTYIGLALVATLPGEGLSIAALWLAIMIPTVNVLCVTVYELHDDTVGVNWRKIGLGIAKNPLVIACSLGILWNVLGWLPPLVIMDVMDKLGLMALPLGLLAVGAGLRLKALKDAGSAFVWSAIVKLIMMPLLAILFAGLLGGDGLSLQVLILFAGLPTASSAYILARQMGGNAELMAGMITGHTLLSLLTLPVLLWLIV